MPMSSGEDVLFVHDALRVADACVDKILDWPTNRTLELFVCESDIFYSTGMVSLPSGVVSFNDVSRALDAAMNMHAPEELHLPVSNDFLFKVDDKIEVKSMPIGILGRFLEAKVPMVRLPISNTVWHRLHEIQGNTSVRWSIE